MYGVKYLSLPGSTCTIVGLTNVAFFLLNLLLFKQRGRVIIELPCSAIAYEIFFEIKTENLVARTVNTQAAELYQ